MLSMWHGQHIIYQLCPILPPDADPRPTLIEPVTFDLAIDHHCPNLIPLSELIHLYIFSIFITPNQYYWLSVILYHVSNL